MKTKTTQPGISTGLMAGALLTAALLGIFHLGWRLAGLPFPPFAIFDWMVRTLPGSIVTFAIDSMTAMIRALNIGDTDTVAKTAEQIMAIILFLAPGSLAGAVLFALARRGKASAFILGPAFGAAAGGVVVLIRQSLDPAMTRSWLIGNFWVLAASLAWGASLGWTYSRLGNSRPGREPVGAAAGDAVTRIDRRQFLIRLGAASASILVSGAVVEALVGERNKIIHLEGQRWSSRHVLPNAGDPVQPAPGTRAEFTPLEEHYRIDISTSPPVIGAGDWRLKISGLVEQKRQFSLDEIRRYPAIHQFVTLACISNPIAGDLIGTTRWTGVSLRRLLDDWKLQPTATHLKISSADGFFETVDLDTIRRDPRVMLTYAWDGLPLTIPHGFPLRIYIPDLYGMKQPKWIESIEAISRWEAGYWVERGWDREARMKAISVIDTVAVGDTVTDTQGRRLVPIGGIAHAGDRGISKVEVQVDDGRWQTAQLRTPLSGLTWVIWRYDWPFAEGEHKFAVRCYDGSGRVQISQTSSPHPSGATGLHRHRALL